MVAHTPDCPQIWENRRREKCIFVSDAIWLPPHESRRSRLEDTFSLLTLFWLLNVWVRKDFHLTAKGEKENCLKKSSCQEISGKSWDFPTFFGCFFLACVFFVISSLFLFELPAPCQHFPLHHNLLLDLVLSIFAFPALSAPTFVAFRPPWRGHSC